MDSEPFKELQLKETVVRTLKFSLSRARVDYGILNYLDKVQNNAAENNIILKN